MTVIKRVRTKGHARANVQPAPPPHGSEASSSLTSIGFVISSTYGNLEKSGERCFSRFSEWQKSFFCLEILVPASLRFQPVLPPNPRSSMILSVELSGYLCYTPSPIWTLRSCHGKYGFLGPVGSNNSACDRLCISPVVMKQPFVKSSSTWSVIGLLAPGTVRYFQNDFNLGRQRGSSCPFFISLLKSQKLAKREQYIFFLLIFFLQFRGRESSGRWRRCCKLH